MGVLHGVKYLTFSAPVNWILDNIIMQQDNTVASSLKHST